MKKVLFSLGLAGLMFTSCQNDEPLAGAEGTEQQVSFTLAVPEAIQTRGASYSDSKAGSLTNVDNYNVTFTAALYLQDELVWSGQKAVGNQNSVEFTPTLVIGQNYKLVAYAEHNVNATEAGLDAIEVETPALTETVDEFFLSTDIEAAPQMSGVLKRPYGKLRLLAEDYAEAERQFNSTIKSVKVVYTDNAKHYTTFDAVDGVFETESVANNTKTAEEVAEYAADNGFKTIFADYLPVNGTEAAMFPFTVEVTFADGTVFTRDFKYDIPVKRNYVTTLTGNLFTMGSTLRLEVDEEFAGEEESEYSSDLEWIALNGGTYTLTEDVELDESLIVKGDMVLDLNGKNITVTSNSSELEEGDAIIVYGNLTINGEGTVAGYTRAIWARGNDGATVTINGGTFTGSQDGNSSVVYASGNGTVNINGGSFEALVADPTSFADKSGVYAALNMQDSCTGGINVYGGKFVKQNPAQPGTELASWNASHPNGFVAEGYASVEVTTGVYEVCAAPVADANGNIELTADATVVNAIALNNGAFNGNGNTLNVSENVATNLLISGKGDVTVSNVTVNGGNYMYGTKSTRALYFDGVGGDVVIDNVHVSGVGYALNVNSSNRANDVLTVKNSSLVGWSSYSAFNAATFTNVYFGVSEYFGTGDNMFNGGIRPYNATTFENCEFESGYYISFAQGVKLTFKNCTVNGVVVDASNFTTLLKTEAYDANLVAF